MPSACSGCCARIWHGEKLAGALLITLHCEDITSAHPAQLLLKALECCGLCLCVRYPLETEFHHAAMSLEGSSDAFDPQTRAACRTDLDHTGMVEYKRPSAVQLYM